jgi:hypothetical protein
MTPRHRSGAGDPLHSLQALRTLLSTASDVAERLHDPLLTRWISVFTAMPAEDRETILGIVEREVAFRAHSTDGHGTLSGMRTGRPNPNARLYARTFSQDDVPFLPFDQLVHATVTGARLTHRSLAARPPAALGWKDALLAAFEALTPDELDAVMWTNRLVLELAGRVRETAGDKGG